MALAACAVKNGVKPEFVMGGQPVEEFREEEECEDLEVENIVFEDVEDLDSTGVEQVSGCESRRTSPRDTMLMEWEFVRGEKTL